MAHPFHWVPAEGQRHASRDRRPGGGYPTGLCVETLCRQQLVADNSENAWFWGCCPRCNEEAHKLAAVPMPPARSR